MAASLCPSLPPTQFEKSLASVKREIVKAMWPYAQFSYFKNKYTEKQQSWVTRKLSLGQTTWVWTMALPLLSCVILNSCLTAGASVSLSVRTLTITSNSLPWVVGALNEFVFARIWTVLGTGWLSNYPCFHRAVSSTGHHTCSLDPAPMLSGTWLFPFYKAACSI